MEKATAKSRAKKAGGVKQTPMMNQYLQAKSKFPDCILFFRLGDFYEMFFEDAQLAAEILDIALTSRAKGKNAYPMCGVPHFSAGNYIAKLVAAGHKVAICDQVEDAKQARGIVKREVTRVISPGMITNPEDLKSWESNYLGAVAVDDDGHFGFAFLDVSTADFRMTSVMGPEALTDELTRVRPRELLIAASAQESPWCQALTKRFAGMFLRVVDPSQGEDFSPEQEESLFSAYRDGESEPGACALSAAEMVLRYAAGSLPGSLGHIRRLVSYQVRDHLLIDDTARLDLELLHTLMDGRRKGSLIHSLDKTKTPMGARLLAQWLLYPLIDPVRIGQRLDAVEEFCNDKVVRDDLTGHLAGIRDLERLLAKVSVGQATPRDLGVLRDSLGQLPAWAALVKTAGRGALLSLVGAIDELADLYRDLAAALVDEPPVETSEGGWVRQGFQAELDRLVDLAGSGRNTLAQMELEERQKTGIPSLKIRYNRVFGYFIEVTKSKLHLVPAHYRRKQTTANAERYETDELKMQEEAVLSARDNRVTLEREILDTLMSQVQKNAERVLAVARQVAASDVILAFARAAVDFGYCRPIVDGGEAIEIEQARHPVVEQFLESERFVPNDLKVDCDAEQILLITGPNMAGKSTIIRQAALLTIMAQMGSFVPASSARIGIVDRIFTRIGATDSLARGLSTFMVEMTETAHILRHATRKSLIILDEVGRGTSTFDGLSIAWAVAEFVHDQIGARTLFATHYHQLTDLSLTKNRVVNYTIAVKEWKDQIVFLRNLIRGASNRSYGIAVGKLAGLPSEVIERSRQILANLEGEAYDEVGVPCLARPERERGKAPGQLGLFTPAPVPSWVEEELNKLDLDNVTPLEALKILHRLKGEA